MNNGVIALRQRGDQQGAQARTGKDEFDRYCAAHDPAQTQAEDRHHGQHGVTQHMLQLYAPVRQALGVQHQHKITAAYIQHGSSRDP